MREVLDEEAGIHHRFLEHAAGICCSRSISFKVYVIGYVCNIKYVSHINVFQVHFTVSAGLSESRPLIRT